MSRSEIQRICRRLREIVEPVFSHETWAAAFFGAFVALLVTILTLPHEKTHQERYGVLIAATIFSGLLFIVLATLAYSGKKQRRHEASLVADELEEICDERMGKV